MKEKVMILGSGGHCKVIVDILLENNEYEVAGLIDFTETNIWGIKTIGTDSDLKQLYGDGIKNAFIAIGNNEIRAQLYKELDEIGFNVINIISKKSVISKYVSMGQGNVIMPGAIINAGTNIGNCCIVNTNSHIDHDCNIGDFTHIAPGAGLCGNVKIGKRCFVCTGANIIDNITIIDDVVVGAGAAVIKDLKTKGVVVGVPAQLVTQ